MYRVHEIIIIHVMKIGKRCGTMMFKGHDVLGILIRVLQYPMDYRQIKHSKIIVRCSLTVCTNVEKYLHLPSC